MSEIGDTQAEETYVVGFDDERATERMLVGGKGANLARLTGAGLPVPAGFCVTTAAYEVLIDEPAIQDAIHELSALEPPETEAIAEVGADLRTRIREQDIPQEIRSSIEDALETTTGNPEQPYAVRSSATAEDLPEASFAGQQETFLNVYSANEIIDRVRDCMASLFTDRAIAYRAKNTIPHTEVALAVVVQRMVAPEVSGVLFTADPQTENRHIASIEAGIGLGEALVSGEVTADSVRVDTQTGEILDYEIGDQQLAVRALAEGGTETVALDSTDRVLTDEQVRTLVELGAEIETLFECPQDIEWCLADGAVSIVQARPITSLFPLPSPLPSDDRFHAYISWGHAGAMNEAMPPLVRDVWISFTQLLAEEYGLDADTQWTVEAGGRLYIDMTPFLRIGLLRRRIPDLLVGFSEPLSAALEDLLDRRGEEFEAERTIRETLTLLGRFLAVAWTDGRPMLSMYLGGYVGAFIGEPNPPEHEEDRWNTWGRTVAGHVRASESPTERARAVFEPDYSEFTDIPHAGPLSAAMTAESVLQRLLPDVHEDVHETRSVSFANQKPSVSGDGHESEALVGNRNSKSSGNVRKTRAFASQSETQRVSDDVNDVAKGLPDELVTRINLGLGDLADVARDHPDVAEALKEDASLDEIESCEGGEAFRAALDEYLEEFGHRATDELDLSRPRWREDPSGLLATVRANLEHEHEGEHREHLREMERKASAAAERLEERADRGLLGPIRKRVVRQLIRTYRGYIQTREYPKQGFARIFEAWHEALRDAGEVLVTDGRLDTVDDVWFLRKEELFTALEGDPIEIDIAARRAEFERQTTMNAPPVLTSEGEVPSAAIEREGVPEGALVGTGVSAGVVEGTARVVRDPTEETVETGEILIAPSSDPGWTPLFLNAAGMVVEVGGQMSHGALVAREYGLPAVVSVPEATRRIETGQRVRIDGTQGTVEIIEGDHE